MSAIGILHPIPMDFSFKEEEEEFGFDHFLFDDVFFQVPEERNQLKRGAKEISENNLPQNTNDSDRSVWSLELVE